MAASYLLLFGCFAAAHAVLALVRARFPSALAMAFFFSGWITMEFALLHIVWQVPVVVALIALGGLEFTSGWWGLALTLGSWVGFAVAWRRMAQARPVVESALADLPDLAETDLSIPSVWFRPTAYDRRDVVVERNLSYGPSDERHVLDVYRRVDRPAQAPTLVTVHGGGWMRGSKDRQAQPLAWRLAAQGWTVAAVNYRLSPAAAFPDHVVDIKRAIGWLREHADLHGVDPDRIALSGGSAGAHLAAVAALTADRQDLQPGFESTDTSVSACVPFYGIYDIVPSRRPARGGARLAPFLAKHVLQVDPHDDPVRWDLASPITLAGEDAPPFLVLHGALDTVLLVEHARRFVDRLATVGVAEARLIEIPGAQHAFDVFRTPRADAVVDGVVRWLDHCMARSGSGAAPAQLR